MQGVMKIFETSNLLVKAVPIQPLCEMQLTYFSRRRMQHWPHVKSFVARMAAAPLQRSKILSMDRTKVPYFEATKVR